MNLFESPLNALGSSAPAPLPTNHGGHDARASSRCVAKAAGLALLVSLLLTGLVGCGPSIQRIDARLARGASQGLNTAWQVRLSRYEDDEEYIAREPAGGSVILGELLAIFPGVFVHGIGHYYAGDYESARAINKIGQWGYLLTALGGGMVTGAHFLDQSSDHILPVSLYTAGGGVGAVGLAYFFTAWFSDIWDTPRAIRSGGEPWAWLEDDMDFFN